MNKDEVAVVISVISLAGSVIGYVHNRRTFIFTVVGERATAVKIIWEKTKFNMTNEHTLIQDAQWDFWSPMVSDIVSSIIIIKKLTGSYKFFQYILGIKDFYVVFWEQLPTDLRTLVEQYKVSNGVAENKPIHTFQHQMKTILKTYKK
ncbi:MAG: hypothetical protein RLZZ172_482 [Bacteroidota bacterium]|jgi:hypothetical protein